MLGLLAPVLAPGGDGEGQMTEADRIQEYLRIRAEIRVALLFNPCSAGPFRDLRGGDEKEWPAWDIFPGVDKDWKA